MEVNEGKNYKKKKMTKGLKINLPLAVEWLEWHVLGVTLLAGLERVFGAFTFGFLEE